MATVSREIAEAIMNGEYEDDERLVIKIVRYTSKWGTESYGVLFEGENPDRYAESPYVRNPEVIWLRELGRIE